ncbi:hypothetical protein ACIBCR_16245 [Micromonospora echinospora]|uniref:hypothetical protein n=1 Tax=Micromonospora echinospora TaxID=1877 RepID=UPI003799EDB3
MADPIRATPDPAGRPPHPDGDTVPCPSRPTGPPLSRRQWIYGALCVLVALAAIVIGVAR